MGNRALSHFRGDKQQAAFVVRSLRSDIGYNSPYLKFILGFVAVPQGIQAEFQVKQVYNLVMRYNNRNKPRKNGHNYHNAYSIIGQALYVKNTFPYFLDAAVVIARAIVDRRSEVNDFETEARTAVMVWRDTLHLADPINYDVLYGIARKHQLYD